MESVTRTPTGASSAAILVGGLVAGSVLAAGFAALALGVRFEGAWIGQTDRAIAAALGSLPGVARDAAALAAALGDALPALVGALCVAVVFAVSRRWLDLVAWIVALAGNGVWTWALKRLLGRARPLDADGLAMSATFSFPSAHSAGLLVACGLLAYMVSRSRPARTVVPVVAFACLFAAAVGAGRVLLGYHHASDVLAGFLSGGVWLTACIVAVELVRRRAAAVRPALPRQPEALAPA